MLDIFVNVITVFDLHPVKGVVHIVVVVVHIFIVMVIWIHLVQPCNPRDAARRGGIGGSEKDASEAIATVDLFLIVK